MRARSKLKNQRLSGSWTLRSIERLEPRVVLSTTGVAESGSVGTNDSAVHLEAEQPVTIRGSIGRTGEQDIVDVFPLQSGRLAFRQQSPGFPGHLQIIAAEASTNTRLGTLTLDADDTLSVFVEAQQLVRLQISGLFGATGDYGLELELEGFLEDIQLEADRATIRGVIDSPGESDVARIAAQPGGLLTIRQNPQEFPGPVISLIVTDELPGRRRPITSDNDFALFAGPLTTFVEAEREVILEIANFGQVTGGYDLEIERQAAVELSANVNASVAGVIDTLEDVDQFAFVAPSDGVILVEQLADTVELRPLRILDADLNEIDSHSVESLGQNRVAFMARARETYFVETAAEFGTGHYLVKFSRPNAENPPEPETEDIPNETVDIGVQDRLFRGRIAAAGEVDELSVRFASPGIVSIAQMAPPGSGLDSLVTVLDSTGLLLASDDDGGQGFDSLLTIGVGANQTIRILPSGFGNSTGDYLLRIALAGDDVGSEGRDLVLDGDVVEFTGAIEISGDTDLFRLPFDVDQVFEISLDAVGGSSLDPVLIARDTGAPAGRIQFSDDDGPGLNSFLVVSAAAADSEEDSQESTQRQVEIIVSGFDTTTGSYRLRVSTAIVDDDVPAGMSRSIPLNEDGFGQSGGRIEILSDLDRFSFIAPRDGTVTVEQNAQQASSLDPVLRVLGPDGVEIASDDDGGRGLNSRVSFGVQSQRTYFIDAGAFVSDLDEFAATQSTLGDYELRVQFADRQDDFGDSLAQAQLIDFTGLSFVRPGTISEPLPGANTDVDVFAFRPALTGTVELRIQSLSPSLIPTFSIFTSDEFADGRVNTLALLDAAEENSGDLGLSTAVNRGQLYFVRVSGLAASSGNYELTGRIETDEVSADFDQARSLDGGHLQSAIDRPNDVDVFRIVAPDIGRYRVTVAATDRALDPVLTVYSEDQVPIGRSDDISAANSKSELAFNTQRVGEPFFLHVAGFEDSRGDYEITVVFSASETATEPGDIPRDAFPLTLADPNVQVTNQFESVSDTDYFTFVAPTDGRLIASLSAPPDGLRPSVQASLRILSAGEPSAALQANVDFLTQVASGDAEVRIDLDSGVRYYIEARRGDNAPEGLSDLEYFLALQFSAEVDSDDSVKPLDERISEAINQQYLVTLVDGVLQSIQEPLTVAGDAVLEELRAALGLVSDAALDDNYFIIVLDPVDFLLTDPRDRTVGFTVNSGPVNEVRGAYHSGNGFAEVVVISGAKVGTYHLQLSGAGSDPNATFHAFLAGPNGVSPLNADHRGESRAQIEKNVTLALNFGDSAASQQAFPMRTVDVFGTLAELMSRQNPAGQMQTDDLLLAQAAVMTQLTNAEIVQDSQFGEQPDGPQSLFRRSWEAIRRIRRIAGEVLGLERPVTSDEDGVADGSDSLDGDGIGDTGQQNPVDAFWTNFGKALMSVSGPVFKLIDFIDSTSGEPAAAPHKRDREQPPLNPQRAQRGNAVIDHLSHRPDTTSSTLARSERRASRDAVAIRQYRRPSPWDYRPEQTDVSWPWEKVSHKVTVSGSPNGANRAGEPVKLTSPVPNSGDAG